MTPIESGTQPLPSTDVQFWDISKDPELVARMLEVAVGNRNVFEILETAEPVDPETGEPGVFDHHVGSFPYFTTVYRTESGKLFSISSTE